jgi:hypothetical protein
MEKADEELVYRAPPKNEEVSARRVYRLPRSLVEKIHKHGYDKGHESEVSAVRELLYAGLMAFRGQP